MNTLQLIKALTDTHTSDYTRLEALYTLTKHNTFKAIKDDLIDCYYNESFDEASKLVKIEQDKANIIPKQGNTIYTLKNKIAKQNIDSRQTLGHMITIYGNDNGWLYAMDTLARYNYINSLEHDKLFIDRVNNMKGLLKRKARLSKVKLSKQGKATKYHKRAVPIAPSQR